MLLFLVIIFLQKIQKREKRNIEQGPQGNNRDFKPDGEERSSVLSPLAGTVAAAADMQPLPSTVLLSCRNAEVHRTCRVPEECHAQTSQHHQRRTHHSQPSTGKALSLRLGSGEGMSWWSNRLRGRRCWWAWRRYFSCRRRRRGKKRNPGKGRHVWRFRKRRKIKIKRWKKEEEVIEKVRKREWGSGGRWCRRGRRSSRPRWRGGGGLH